MKSVKLLLVGIGGYAFHYVDALLDNPPENVEIAGLVDPFPSSCRRLSELMAKNIPLYGTMDEFYSNPQNSAQLAIITTPIQFHTEHILTALKHGTNVLCEKPLCAHESDIEKIIDARTKAGKFVDIGYQWSHNQGVLSMKADILNGVYGKPIFMKSITLWPRGSAYFNRGIGWAGKLYDQSGRAVFDSVAGNATAHHLHNIFFLCGSQLRSSAHPCKLDATLMRTNPIETFDTALLSGRLENGADFVFAASHATDLKLGPVCEYIFEKGTITLGALDGTSVDPHFIGRLADGKTIDYGNPSDDLVGKMYFAIEAARAEAINTEPCPVEAAAVHTKVINSLHKSFTVQNTRRELVTTKQDSDQTFTYVKGLDNALISIYKGDNISLEDFLERNYEKA